MSWKTILYILFLIYIFYRISEDTDYESIPLKTIIEYKTNISNALGELAYNDTNSFNDIRKNITDLFEQNYENKFPVYYHNISGVFTDTWSKSEQKLKIIDEKYNLTDIDSARGDFNYDSGDITYSLYENQTINDNINFIEGYIRIKNKSEYTMNIKGMHFISNGEVYLYGIPLRESFPLREISLMMRSEQNFNQSIEVLQARLKYDIDLLEERLKKDKNASEKYYKSNDDDDDDDKINPDDDYYDEKPSKCKFNIFFKLKPADLVDEKDLLKYEKDLLEYENELKNPTGVKPLLKTPPKLEGDSILYSENCNLLLKLNVGAEGKKIENIIKKYIYATVGSMIMTLTTVVLTLQQYKYTSSQPLLSKVSWISQLMISFLNLIVITINILMGTSINGYNSILFITSASFKGIAFIFFEKNYISAVMNAQTNLINNGNNSILIICYWLFSFIGQIFILTLLNGRLIAFYIVMFILYSYWVPQIILNIKKNAEKPLSNLYLYGTSITQLYILIFIYNLDSNINIDKFNIKFLYIIIIYTLLQVLILSLQNIYGPLFLIPNKLLPERYDYHPILPIYDDKNEEQIDANDASASAPLKGISISQQCAICYNNIIEDNKVNNKEYMITPCHHIFHTECLKHWMNIKMECPVCRTSLPQ